MLQMSAWSMPPRIRSQSLGRILWIWRPKRQKSMMSDMCLGTIQSIIIIIKINSHEQYAQIVPTRVPITPFVRMADLVPEDLHDVRPAYGVPVNTNKIKETWFDADTRDTGFRDVPMKRLAKYENPWTRKLVNRLWTRNAYRTLVYPRRD